MKKLLTIASGLVASSAMAFDMPALKVDGQIEYNTKWVENGAVVSDHNFAPSVEVGLPLFGAGDLYAGVDAHLMTSNGKSVQNRVDPYVGFSYDISDMFTLDVGYTAKIHTCGKKGRSTSGFIVKGVSNVYGVNPANVIATVKALNRTFADANAGKGFLDALREDGTATCENVTINNFHMKKVSHEIYAGIMADVLLKPSLYLSYDITQKKPSVEGAISYTFDLGNKGINGLALDLGAKVGFSHVKKPFGLKRETELMKFERRYAAGSLFNGKFKAGDVVTVGDLYGKKNLFYGQVNADLVYSLNANSKVRAGVGFAFNNAKKNAYVNWNTGKKHTVWFSTAAEFSF